MSKARFDKIIVQHCSDVLLTSRINSTIREFNKLRDNNNDQNSNDYWRKRVEKTMLTIVQNSFAYIVPI